METTEDDCVIPDVLQGEVARLERKFRVSLDPAFQASSKTVHVVCKLGECGHGHKVLSVTMFPEKYLDGFSSVHIFLSLNRQTTTPKDM